MKKNTQKLLTLLLILAMTLAMVLTGCAPAVGPEPGGNEEYHFETFHSPSLRRMLISPLSPPAHSIVPPASISRVTPPPRMRPQFPEEPLAKLT